MLEIYSMDDEYTAGYWKKIDGELTGKIMRIKFEEIKAEVKIKEKERCGFLWLKKRDMEKIVWIDKKHIREIE